MLCRNPLRRASLREVKEHPFFAGVEWGKLDEWATTSMSSCLLLVCAQLIAALRQYQTLQPSEDASGHRPARVTLAGNLVRERCDDPRERGCSGVAGGRQILELEWRITNSVRATTNNDVSDHSTPRTFIFTHGRNGQKLRAYCTGWNMILLIAFPIE